MFVSLGYGDEQPHQFYHRAQSLQLQTSTSQFTSFYHQRQHAQQSVSPYLDYCNTVLPTYSCCQLGSAHGYDGWRQQTTSTCCRSVSQSSTLWTDSVTSQQHVHRSGWVNPQQQQPVLTTSPTTSHYQHQPHVVSPSPDDTLHGTGRPSAVELQKSSRHQSHVGGGSDSTKNASRPSTKSTDVTRSRQQRRTKDALVPLIIRAILSAADERLSLADICRYIAQHSVDYARSNDETRWYNNVRHTLSHYEFFVMSGRVPTGRGNYWTIHPVCRAAFAAHDFRIKRARHAVQVYQKSVNVTTSPQH